MLTTFINCLVRKYTLASISSCLKLAAFGVVVFVGFFFGLNMDCIAQDSNWQQRLPVSMNGKLPEEFPERFEQKYWHSLRLSRFFRGRRKKRLSPLGLSSTENCFPPIVVKSLRKQS